MDDDLFTYEFEIANIPCDLRVVGFGACRCDYGILSVCFAFTEWLGSKFFNYKTMDHYTMKALWIYWIRGDDEVELTDDENIFFINEDEIAEVFRIKTNIFDYKTTICAAFNEFNYLLKMHQYTGAALNNNEGDSSNNCYLKYQTSNSEEGGVDIWAREMEHYLVEAYGAEVSNGGCKS
ncbi:hypothetical protein Tco_0117922 [Tanacetum coccineum]